jgi:hypothetical protein
MAFSQPRTPSYCVCCGGSTGCAGASCVGAGAVSGAGAGLGAGGAADSGAGAGAGAVSLTGGSARSLSDEPCPAFPDRYARVSDVTMNMAAETVVRRDRNVAGPRLPKNVCDEPAPPKAAPIDWPFPTCSRTTRIRARDTVTWTITNNTYNTLTSSRVEESGQTPRHPDWHRQRVPRQYRARPSARQCSQAVHCHRTEYALSAPQTRPICG